MKMNHFINFWNILSTIHFTFQMHSYSTVTLSKIYFLELHYKLIFVWKFYVEAIKVEYEQERRLTLLLKYLKKLWKWSELIKLVQRKNKRLSIKEIPNEWINISENDILVLLTHHFTFNTFFHTQLFRPTTVKSELIKFPKQRHIIALFALFIQKKNFEEFHHSNLPPHLFITQKKLQNKNFIIKKKRRKKNNNQQ